MTFDLDSNSAYVIDLLKNLHELTADEHGAQRLAWTPTWEKAREWFIDEALKYTSDISRDQAGNIWVKYEGKTSESIIIGSHLDSVPNGGWLDGALGVLSGLGVLRHFKMSNTKPIKTIYVVDWADEEGARYGYSCLGSSAAAGSIDINDFRKRLDSNGVDFSTAISNHGLDINNFTEAHDQFLTKLKDITAYLELHIEQGPVLEHKGLDVAAVYGAAGVERYFIDFKGQSAHAGSFPTDLRQDAFLAAAETSIALRQLALKYEAVCTVGSVEVKPNVATIIPESCTISVDMRTIDADDLKSMLAEAKEIAETSASQHQCSVKWRKIYNVQPQLFNQNLVKICQSAVKEETGVAESMYSGPLHDAVEINKHLPTVMMFIMSKDGLSHTKEEDTPLESLATGIRAYFRLVEKVLNQ